MSCKPIVLIGDSLTHRHHFNSIDASNFGIDGDTTDGVLARLSQTKEAKTIVLMIGVNDILMNVPMAAIQRNYEKIFAQVTSEQELIILSLLPVIDDPQTKTINRNILTLNSWLQEKAKQYNRQFIDLYPLFSDGKGLKEAYSLDGIHLSISAYQVWEKQLKQLLSLQ